MAIVSSPLPQPANRLPAVNRDGTPFGALTGIFRYLSQAGAKSQTKEGLKVIGGNDRCNILLRNKPAAHIFPPEAVFKKGQGNAR
jgi:hypothetical protein